MKFWALVGSLLLVACVESRNHGPGHAVDQADAAACQDADGDGYGEGCTLGGDCNDADDSIHVACQHCEYPQEGCGCSANARPISCYLAPSSTDDGTVMCHEGTRYCRDGHWSACESIVTYPKPTATNTQAIVAADAGPSQCNDCSVNCFVIRDNLDPVDAGIDGNAQSTQLNDGGSLSLTYTLQDAGPPMDAGTFDPSTCVLGTAPDQDCDGIPDEYDPYPNQKPFATANPTIFLDIAPGETGTGVINLQFYLNSADVYFLVDQTGSMAGERDQLKADLVTGNFINDPTYNCADYDFDRQPNNELKSQGIIGAIRCIIRDANFGVGYFRELPFQNSSTWPSFYGYTDSVTYRHLQDITSNLDLLPTAVAKLNTVGNIDWPEASMVALYSTVTGNGMYLGTTRPGVPTRSGCSSQAWGYPCFRASAIPIVILFTDAPFHNGPAPTSGPAVDNDPYNTAYLGITAGSNSSYYSVSPTNETFSNAYDLGDLTNKFYSYIGNTESMTSDLPYSTATCSATGSKDAPDALFKFSLSSTKTVNLNTTGSDFDTTLSLFRGTSTAATDLASYPNTNDTGANAYSFGSVANKYVRASGNSSTLKSDYSANDISCGAVPGAKDATFTFSLSSSTKVALDTAGSSYGTVVGLFSGTPTATSYTAITNSNDTLASAYSVGTLNSKNLGFSGDTSAAGITANYPNSLLSCAASPGDLSPDAVYSFTLSSATRVRLSAADSPSNTVLMLTDNGTQYPNLVTLPSNANELQANAYDLGAMDGKAYTVSGGDTSAMNADYPSTTTSCSSSSSAKDAVYKFNLTGTKTVSIDTSGSSFDTVLSLFKTTIARADTYIDLSANNYNNANERGNVAYDLGGINAKRYIVTGGSTSNMAADYNTTQTGSSCASNSGNSGSPDAIFKFRVNTATRVRMDTNSSSFDTVMSLHNGPLPDLQVTSLSNNNNEAVASAYPVAPSNLLQNARYDGSTGSMTPDVPVDDAAGCNANSAGADAVYKLTITSAGNYELNTTGSSFDTVLGLYPSTVTNATPPTPTAKGTQGDTKATAIPIGAMENKWYSFTGDTTNMNTNDSTSSFTNCSAASGSHDVFYSFTLTSTKTISIDTIGSSFNTTLGLYNSSMSQITCNNDGVVDTPAADRITRSLSSGTYYVVIKGVGSNSVAGQYKLTIRDATSISTTNMLSCDNDSGSGTASKITTYLSAGTYYAVVKGRTSTDKGNYSLAVKALDLIDSANRVTCDDDSGSSSASMIDMNLGVGDYWVVVKGYRDSRKGDYQFTVQDMNTAPTDYQVTCNDDANGSTNTSLISQSLTSGTYYVVVKGGSSGASGPYKLTIRDTAVSMVNNLACDYNSGAGGKPLIEKDLSAGTYRVIVKGKSDSDKGPYKIILRDLTALPTKRLSCDRNSGSGGKSYLESTLGSGTYTIVLSSDSSSGAGDYKLAVRDANNIATMDTPLSCNNDVNGSDKTSSLSSSLSAGTYYVSVKGYTTSDVGQYQLNIGAGSTSSSTYTPPTWSQTLAALNAKQVRVLPILSCKDDSQHGDSYHGSPGDCVTTRSQATELARATDSLGSNLSPLVFDILSDGSGLSKTVVDGVAALAHYLEMDVFARVVFEPDANPGFDVVVRAVDSETDGCSGLVGIEHKNCVPGASPRFEISFTNPADRPVPLNPSDPNGGYNFKAELIGDSQFVVDQVPIYIIPADVNPVPEPVPQVASSGSYWQDIAAPGCSGNQRPDWHDLKWNADVPLGTSVTFNVCASDATSDLGSCNLAPVCTVTGGAACTSDSQCPNGFCSTAGNCNTITAGACTLDSDCTLGGVCTAGTCTFSGQPVYVGGVLGVSNYQANLRLNIGMTGNTTTNKSPTVHDWSVTYLCNSVL